MQDPERRSGEETSPTPKAPEPLVVEGGLGPSTTTEELGPPPPRPLDPLALPLKQEETRKWIVQALFIVFTLALLLPFVVPSLSAEHWDYLKIALSGLIGLLGTAIGFYFRSG